MAISILVEPSVTTVTASLAVTTVTANLALPDFSSSRVLIDPIGSLSATTLQEALEQLADQDFRQSSTPSGINVQEGDTWYDTENNSYKVYREVSTGVFAWTDIVFTNTDSVLDAGAF
jgi:hypothetical protein